MAIKYVHDYRASYTNDADIIQAAIEDVNDGDTLVFEPNTTYTLNKTVQFTKCHPFTSDGQTYTNKTKKNVTFIGSGCTITYTADIGANNICFLLSDSNTKFNGYKTQKTNGNGLFGCTISGFNFVGNNSVEDVQSMGPLGGVSGSDYTSYCDINNCSFMYFNTALYFAGETNKLHHCRFSSCTTAINCDCPNDSEVYSNIFIGMSEIGIQLTIPFRTKVHDNYFYSCAGTLIRAVGVTDYQHEVQDIDNKICVSITSNYLGGKSNTNQNGIYMNGIKHAVVENNFIYGMSYNNDSTAYGNGICITGSYNPNHPSGIPVVKSSCNIIVSNNNIWKCMRDGISIDKASESVLKNNIIIAKEECSSSRGIYCGLQGTSIAITDNDLYYFETNNGLVSDAHGYNIYRDNNIYSSDIILDPLDTTRHVYAVNSGSNGVLSIPSSVVLENDDVFFLHIPSDYSWSTVTYVSYNNNSAIVTGINNLTSYAGKFIKVKYSYGTSKYGAEYISFTPVE